MISTKVRGSIRPPLNPRRILVKHPRHRRGTIRPPRPDLTTNQLQDGNMVIPPHALATGTDMDISPHRLLCMRITRQGDTLTHHIALIRKWGRLRLPTLVLGQGEE
jgi:hypothetical protein